MKKPMFNQILRTWVSLQQSQWLEKRKLADIQDTKLKRIFNNAYHNVPFYNKLYRSHGVDPERVRTVSDLSRLPLIERRIIQEEPLNARSCGDRSEC